MKSIHAQFNRCSSFNMGYQVICVASWLPLFAKCPSGPRLCRQSRGMLTARLTPSGPRTLFCSVERSWLKRLWFSTVPLFRCMAGNWQLVILKAVRAKADQLIELWLCLSEPLISLKSDITDLISGSIWLCGLQRSSLVTVNVQNPK